MSRATADERRTPARRDRRGRSKSREVYRRFVRSPVRSLGKLLGFAGGSCERHSPASERSCYAPVANQLSSVGSGGFGDKIAVYRPLGTPRPPVASDRIPTRFPSNAMRPLVELSSSDECLASGEEHSPHSDSFAVHRTSAVELHQSPTLAAQLDPLVPEGRFPPELMQELKQTISKMVDEQDFLEPGGKNISGTLASQPSATADVIINYPSVNGRGDVEESRVKSTLVWRQNPGHHLDSRSRIKDGDSTDCSFNANLSFQAQREKFYAERRENERVQRGLELRIVQLERQLRSLSLKSAVMCPRCRTLVKPPLPPAAPVFPSRQPSRRPILSPRPEETASPNHSDGTRQSDSPGITLYIQEDAQCKVELCTQTAPSCAEAQPVTAIHNTCFYPSRSQVDQVSEAGMEEGSCQSELNGFPSPRSEPSSLHSIESFGTEIPDICCHHPVNPREYHSSGKRSVSTAKRVALCEEACMSHGIARAEIPSDEDPVDHSAHRMASKARRDTRRIPRIKKPKSSTPKQPRDQQPALVDIAAVTTPSRTKSGGSNSSSCQSTRAFKSLAGLPNYRELFQCIDFDALGPVECAELMCELLFHMLTNNPAATIRLEQAFQAAVRGDHKLASGIPAVKLGSVLLSLGLLTKPLKRTVLFEMTKLLGLERKYRIDFHSLLDAILAFPVLSSSFSSGDPPPASSTA